MGIVLIARCYTRGPGNGFSSRNFWLWLINHGVPRNEIDRQPIKVCLDLFNQSYSRSGEQRSHWSRCAEEFGVHRPSITQWRGGRCLWENILLNITEAYWTFCPVLSTAPGSCEGSASALRKWKQTWEAPDMAQSCDRFQNLEFYYRPLVGVGIIMEYRNKCPEFIAP